jgi:anti-sigma regulatory factor (Ser/Thr protein kinase)
MRRTSASPPSEVVAPFHHHALLYRGEAEFVSEIGRFVDAGLAGDEAVLVAVPPAKISLLKAVLGGRNEAAEQVSYVDLTAVGRNPAAMLPLWSDFVDRYLASGRRCRGISESVWPERAAAALTECRTHEALINLDFQDGPGWALMCAYDADELGDRALTDAAATHPSLLEGGEERPNSGYDPVSAGWLGYDDPLPAPASPPRELEFSRGALREVRNFVTDFAVEEGAAPDRVADLTLAVNEVVANSVRYGGGDGAVGVWRDGDTLLCEVSDGGTISDPFAGRRRPTSEQFGGRGLWIANRACDLVQVRSSPGRTTVRLHMELDGPAG